MANDVYATFASGCFWCTEAIFQDVRGVNKVTPGYIGGHVSNPSYQQVCNGNTGHAEAVQLRFDPEQISYDDLLTIFWHSHDPTTRDRQGADVGTQYRSAIFYHDDSQKQQAEASKAAADASGEWPSPIVTEITPCDTFYAAEAYHHNFYLSNPNQGYCRLVIDPKVQKFRRSFQDKLRNPTGALG